MRGNFVASVQVKDATPPDRGRTPFLARIKAWAGNDIKRKRNPVDEIRRGSQDQLQQSSEKEE
jgi:hypothetical protein